MLTKRNKVWHYQTKIRGRTFKRSTGQTDKAKALRMVPEFERQARLRRELSAASPSSSLFQAIADETQRIEMDIGPRQAKRTSYGLMNFAKFVRDLPLERLPADILAQFQRHRIATAARSTVQKEVRSIQRLLRGRRHSVQKPPSLTLGAVHPNRAFTDAELHVVFQAASKRYRDLYLVLLTTGARLAEIVPSSRSAHVPLLKCEVDYDAGAVTIRTAKMKPGAAPAEPRLVHVPRETLDALRREAAQSFGPRVFRPLNKPARDFQGCLRRAGIPKMDPLGRKLTLHSFRHTYATLAAVAVGQNQFLLQRILGHRQISTTAQYCHPTAPKTVVNLGFLADRPSQGSQTGSQGGEREEKASA